MQVGVDAKCMHTNFSGCSLSSFKDIATFKNSQFSLSDHSPWSSKNLIDQNRLKKFMLVGVNVTCMNTNFGGYSLSGFRDIATFKNGQFFLSDHGLSDQFLKVAISPKLKKLNPPKLVYMHVTLTPTCMNFLSRFHGLSFPTSPWSSKNVIDWNRL